MFNSLNESLIKLSSVLSELTFYHLFFNISLLSLILTVYFNIKSKKSYRTDSIGYSGLFIFFLAIHIVSHALCLALLPDNYILLSYIVIFILPYYLVFFSFFLLKKIKRIKL